MKNENEYFTGTELENIFGVKPDDGAIIAYYRTAVSDGESDTASEIKSYLWDADDDLWWLGCDDFDCVYTPAEITEELAEIKNNKKYDNWLVI